MYAINRLCWKSPRVKVNLPENIVIFWGDYNDNRDKVSYKNPAIAETSEMPKVFAPFWTEEVSVKAPFDCIAFNAVFPSFFEENWTFIWTFRD